MTAFEPAQSKPAPQRQLDETVRFVLIDPEAHEVFVAGSFNNWNPGATPMIDLGHGRFVREIKLALGHYEYQFVVDGRWMPDRTAKESVVNPFGGINSVIDVARHPVRAAELCHQIDVQPRWRRHYEVLLALRERLVAEQLQRLAEAGEPLERYSLSLADRATDEFDHDLSLSDLSAKQDAIYEVDQALRRIIDGTYGVCEVTGKAIPASRLRAVPWTRFSKKVESRLERRRALSRARLGELGSSRRLLGGAGGEEANAHERNTTNSAEAGT